MNRLSLSKVASSLAAVVVLSLTGCASIPVSSGVQLGSEITNNTSTDFLYFSPYDPPVDASINELLAGFLSAGTGPQNDYAVAREYLAANLKTTWLPSQQVVVADTNPEIIVDENISSAKVSVRSTALVDSAGRMSLSLGDADLGFRFGFVKEAGQWRISEAPNLTIVSRPVFDVVFKSYSVYFFDSQRQYLVPDLRWFPSRASTATRLVNALITGPALWLEDSVYNPIPVGTKLAVDAVTVSDGIASMDFNGKFLSVSGGVRSLIKAQIDATLGQISGVRASQISVDRNVQDIAKFVPADVPAVTISPVILTKTALAYVSGGTVTEIDATKAAVSNLQPYDFALKSDNSVAVFSSASGLRTFELASFGSESLLLDARPKLLSPTFDRQGWIWSVESSLSPVIKIFSQTGDPHVLQSTAFVNHKILSFALSPEGARLAVVVKSRLGEEIWLFGVVRNKKGLPTSLSQNHVVPTTILGAKGISWLDGSKLGLLGQSNTGWSQPVEVSIGGFEQKLAGFQGLRQFIGNNAAGARFALNDKGELLQFRSSSWTLLQSGVKQVHYTE